MDVEAYGFRGWIGNSEHSVTLIIFPNTISKTGTSATLTFSMLDDGKPVPNLTPSLLKVFVRNESEWTTAENFIMKYLGGGNYSLTYSSPINEYGLGVKLRAITPKDRIIVSACYIEEMEPVDWGKLYIGVEEKEPKKELLLPRSRLSFKTRQNTPVIHKISKNEQHEISSPQIPENVFIDMRETICVNITLRVQPSGQLNKLESYRLCVDLFFFNRSSGENKSICEPKYLNITSGGDYTIKAYDHCRGIIPGGSIVYIRITLIVGNTLHIILNQHENLYSYVELGKAYYTKNS